MKYFASGERVNINIDFIINDEYFTPTVGTVKYTLKDNSNLPIAGQVNVPIVTTATTTNVVLDLLASYNIKEAEKSFEYRFLEISGLTDGKPFIIRERYRLIDSNVMLLDPENVRLVLGVNSSELPDRDIDVYTSYFKFNNLYGEDFRNKFSSGDISALYAEAMVYLDTALNLLPSLRLKVAQNESDGVVKFGRFTRIDWDALEAQLRNKLEEALDGTGVSTTIEPTLGVLGSFTDYFPGG